MNVMHPYGYSHNYSHCLDEFIKEFKPTPVLQSVNSKNLWRILSNKIDGLLILLVVCLIMILSLAANLFCMNYSLGYHLFTKYFI